MIDLWDVRGKKGVKDEYNVASSRFDGDGSLLLDSGKGIAHRHSK